ncbi:hypothetical protein FQA39_LY02308 [Lamprigera yunnana]|nr:hypothetical protein FQA39_LY02308 [Lamprigera yunnana]
MPGEVLNSQSQMFVINYYNILNMRKKTAVPDFRAVCTTAEDDETDSENEDSDSENDDECGNEEISI